MTIYNLGSINIDYVYEVAHLPGPGETIAAPVHRSGLGGKGANQSVAAARAGAEVRHIGAIGEGGGWAVERLRGFGVNVDHVGEVPGPTAHAIIAVDPSGENAIILHAGANAAQSEARIAEALNSAGPGDTLLLQNETSHQVLAAKLGREKGMRVIYSAAPFSVDAVREVLPHVSLLALNAIEEAQLTEAIGVLEVPEMIVTRGADGASWALRGAETVSVAAFPVSAVDTTGAGDCFIGTVAAALDRGAGREEALREAAAAAAIQVTRPGTADVMPARDEVLAFLETAQ
ncbi:MAG: ribokinase [Paracoccaceae bacterium]